MRMPEVNRHASLERASMLNRGRDKYGGWRFRVAGSIWRLPGSSCAERLAGCGSPKHGCASRWALRSVGTQRISLSSRIRSPPSMVSGALGLLARSLARATLSCKCGRNAGRLLLPPPGATEEKQREPCWLPSDPLSLSPRALSLLL